MLTRSTLFAAAALLALSACSEGKVETEKAAGGVVNIAADTETGKMEIKLPGGLEAKVNIPEGMADHSKFEVGGVGLYPGAKVGSVNVNATERKHNGAAGHNAVVAIGFTAPADAAAVADWYQQQFEAKKVSVRRSGETLTGKTDDGDDFSLALTPAATGSSGLLTIVDAS
jgi:hypothetical protein